MSQRAKKTVSILTILLTVGLGAIFLRAAIADTNSTSDTASDPPPVVMEGPVEVLLLRMGLDPDAFAAAGVSGTGLQSALALEQDLLEGALATLASRDAAYAEAKVTVDALRRKVRRGQASTEEVQQLATAKTVLAAATSARDTLLDGLAEDLLENFSDGAAATLRQIRSSQRWKNIPVAYRLETRTQAQWVEIRNALAAERTHEAIGDGVPQEVQTFLSNLDSDEDVSAAATRLDANLSGVQSTWDTAFGH